MGEVRRRVVLGGVAGSAALTVVPASAWADESDVDGRDAMRPVGLTAEHVINPLGIDALAPRLGWRLEAGGVDRAQSAYQIMVASSPDLLVSGRPDVWDTGRVASAQQSAIPYGGPPLRSRSRYHWAVRVWDESARRGPVSEAAWLETALLSEREWTAQWVGSGIVIPRPVRTLGPQRFNETALTPGQTFGQDFLSTSPLVAVAVLLTVAGSQPAGCVMTLRRDGPDGAVLGRKVLSGLVADRYGNAHGRLDLAEPAPPGRLFLELSRPQGTLGWVGVPHDEAYDDGSAYIGAKAVSGDRWVYGIPPDPPADPLVRTEFDLDAPVRSARLYLSGLGHAVAWVNGRRVGDAELSPATTDYDRRILYATHDVTALLRHGGNAIGIALGRGYFATRAPDSESSSNLSRWIAEPQVKAQLEVTLANGRRVTVGTGPEWQLTEGPTAFDGLYTGESYDARRAARLDGWTLPRFRADGWRSVAVVPSPGGRLEAYAGEPVRAGEVIRPVRVSRPAEGVWLYDFGVVLAGWVRLRSRLPAGTTVRLLHSEKLGASGRIEVGTPGGNENSSVGGRFHLDEYTAAGGGAETWQPSFTYKGFRYVEVSGPTQPLDNIVAVPVGSDLASTMELRLDQPVLQWIADAVRQTASNMLRGQPDISPMHTKLGWTIGSYRAAQSMLYLFGMASVFGKWLDDIRLSQGPDGEIPLIAPIGSITDGRLVTPTSTGVYPYLVRRYWLTYGDRTVPEKHFDSVRRYVEWLLPKVLDEIPDEPFGDWYPPRPGRPNNDPPAPEGGELVSKAYTIQTLHDSADLAELVGRGELAAAWRARADELVRRFNEVFLDPVRGVYRTEIPTRYRQTSNAVPLEFGLVPAEHVARVAANLAAHVEAVGRHLDTGHLGTGALPIALSDHGRADLAHAVLAQRSYPSFGYLRDLGATTLWENWEVDARGHNDPALSLPMLWFVERVLGVEALHPGWARFRVAPRAFGPLPAASLSLDTVRGRITVAWRQSAGALTLDLRVPVNAVAELSLPDGTRRDLGSGTHHIVTPLNKQ